MIRNRPEFMKRIAIFILLVLTLALPLRAQFSLPAGKIKSEASLVPDSLAIAPGQKFSVALRLIHPPDWHSYYKNSGGIEQVPVIEWKLPPGFTAAPIQWPVPEVHEGALGKSFIYDGSPVFLVELTPPADLSIGSTVSLTANASWQICSETGCINESGTFPLSLPVAANAAVQPSNQELFATARASLPSSAPLKTSAQQSKDGGIDLRIEPAGATNGTATAFIPDQRFVTVSGGIKRDGDAWVVPLKRVKKDLLDNDIPQGTSFGGILTGPRPVAVPNTVIAMAAPKPVSAGKFLPILWGMLLGGLILNLMPCVFPVIGLKILGFVQQAGSERKKIALHGIVFTVGVLASFGVLSGILFAAAKGSSAVGWGYQWQNPWVVFALMLLMFLLALNMFGVFELGTSATSVGGSLQSKQGLAGSFFSGVLATVVATPCSAPFLGVAIGAAIGLPALQFFAAFAAMAIGLSLPYLLLSIFPKLVDYLPRPGAWMESFKQAMSFLLFATTGYLLWVYSSQIGEDYSLAPMFGLSAIAVAGWIYGRWNLPHRARPVRTLALALTAAFAFTGFMLAKPPVKSTLVWEPWSQQRVDELLKEGKPVYIDFTAHWCATCQVNKKRAYTPAVIKLMKERGIVALRGDKTNPDPAIDAKIQEYGRGAIPVNVLLVPDKEPIITPEILSPAYLTDLFTKEIPLGKK